MNPVKKFLKVSAWLGRVPSLFYALLYVTLIPSFALFYWLMPPRQFYHSTIQFEQYLKRDAQTALGDLESAIKANIERINHSPKLTNGVWVCDSRYVRCSTLAYNNGQFTFMLELEYLAETNTATASFHAIDEVQFSLEHALTEDSELGAKMYFACDARPSGPDSVSQFKSLFPFDSYYASNPGLHSTKPPCGFLVIPDELEEKLRAWVDALSGFPSRTSGNFERMLYLSAETITTVGFGDIVPITPLARMSVTFEAIIGVLMMGLFLNALAQEFNREKS